MDCDIDFKDNNCENKITWNHLHDLPNERQNKNIYIIIWKYIKVAHDRLQGPMENFKVDSLGWHW